MITVAVLILPGLGLLLFSMTCLEDRLFADPGPPRHARRGHLRLLPGGRTHGGASASASDAEPADAVSASAPAPDSENASARRDAA
ncbi:hypothetical protein KVH17_06515 [Streptomyces olivaceus]|uniref:hypothetical protein n=1 Tax=Streptomyces olivaceus TaxID=47716 RepID=UPI001CCC164F|nr:hypothetical protein [Streptomyces olivaceus]MBZ6199370.1 hypothetical protein [Streptomyces olivaceus]MBZ6284168.1 hypothetical protein [Streptomyces olivaceus]MBZ6292145.1 hypothetical protein [Streptomyces olivaceus]MBZ6326879.1 hypothetical protein [Streptomyces olivaceus]